MDIKLPPKVKLDLDILQKCKNISDYVIQMLPNS